MEREKYEVFISFKNSDERGDPTEDALIASELFQELSKRGINAFYSNVRLLQFGEAAYKKAIDEALDEADVFVAVASKKEYLESRWVSYERDSFHNDILSGIKKAESMVSYLKPGVSTNDLPRSLRTFEAFTVEEGHEKIVAFIVNCLKKAAGGKERSFEKSLVTGKRASTYNPATAKELRRLKIQSDNTRPADLPAIEKALSGLSDKKEINVLDAGCAYGFVTEDRFGGDPRLRVLAVDRSDACLEYARAHSAAATRSYEHLDLESEDFEEEAAALMEKHGIPSFDLVFASLVLHHLKNPGKVLRRIRKLMGKGAYIVVRGSDDGSIVSMGDNGLIEKIVALHVSADGISDRFNGRKIYGQLVAAGFADVRMMSYVKDTSGLDGDEKEDIFLERFAYRKNYLQRSYEEDPNNLEKKSKLEAIKYGLEELENVFAEPGFWYQEVDFVGIGRK